MKTIVLLVILFPALAAAQLKTTPVCNTIYVDILAGKVNDLEPDYTQGQVKKTLPCFTSAEAEDTSSSCGGVIRYKNNDIYFYTGRDYVELREKFKGKLSIPVMGAARGSLFKSLGHPKIRDVSWDAYQTQYGTLILYYNKAGRVNKIQFSTKTTESINLCGS